MVTQLSLADLIAPQSVGDFLQTTYSKTYALYKGNKSRLCGLADWGTVNHILETQRFESPRFRVARQGYVLPESDYTEEVPSRDETSYRQIVVSRLLDEVKKGATITIDRVDQAHTPIRELAAAVESALRAKIFVNMFVSWQPVAGFNNHWDDHDVFVLQLEGRKHWKIFGPTRQWPLYRDVVKNEAPEGGPLHEFDLTAGDILYLPHGWWHEVSATGEPSLHITVGVKPDSGVDFMIWLADRMRSYEVLRGRLPRFGTASKQAQYVTAVRACCDELLSSPDILRAFFHETDATSRARPRYALPEVFGDGFHLDKECRVVLTAPRATVALEGEKLVLSALGRRWALSNRVEPLIRLLISSRCATVEDLLRSANGVPEKQLAEILVGLLRAGVLGLEQTAIQT